MAKVNRDQLSCKTGLRRLLTAGRRLARFFVLVLLLLATGCAGCIIRTSDGQKVEFAQMVEALQGARLILVGETHDNKRHHVLQLSVIQALHAKGKPLAIGAEMFAAASQDKLDQWNDGRMDALSFEWLYADNWSEPWLLYRDIFLYARDNAIPIIGLNFSKELMHKVTTQGIASLTEKESAELPPGTSCNFSSPYTYFLKQIYQNHANVGSFENFCVAQTLWNMGMAQRLSDYLKKHPEQTVVALVGSFHAVKQGIPAEIPDFECRVLVPELLGMGMGRMSPAKADFVFRP